MNRRNTLVRVALIGLVAAALPACDSLRETLGMNKSAPDEFAVVTKAPLVLPPEYALRPPDPGAPRPQEVQPRDRAAAALTGLTGDGADGANGRSSGGQTAGEAALLQGAGATGVNPDIRQVINREYSQLAERDESFTDRLIFWQRQPPPGTVIDPAKEAQRLRQNAATGQPVTAGETPIIKRRKRALLEGIF